MSTEGQEPARRRSINDRFLAIADAVSFGMGTPANIGAWILLVAVWIALFAMHLLGPDTNVLPAWFTSNAFNFPLNTVTTLAELYIGFLVAAAANRSERHATSLLDRVAALEAQNGQILAGEIEELQKQGEDLEQHSEILSVLRTLIEENTELTREVHRLATATTTKRTRPSRSAGKR